MLIHTFFITTAGYPLTTYPSFRLTTLSPSLTSTTFNHHSPHVSGVRFFYWNSPSSARASPYHCERSYLANSKIRIYTQAQKMLLPSPPYPNCIFHKDSLLVATMSAHQYFIYPLFLNVHPRSKMPNIHAITKNMLIIIYNAR